MGLVDDETRTTKITMSNIIEKHTDLGLTHSLLYSTKMNREELVHKKTKQNSSDHVDTDDSYNNNNNNNDDAAVDDDHDDDDDEDDIGNYKHKLTIIPGLHEPIDNDKLMDKMAGINGGCLTNSGSDERAENTRIQDMISRYLKTGNTSCLVDHDAMINNSYMIPSMFTPLQGRTLSSWGSPALRAMQWYRPSR